MGMTALLHTDFYCMLGNQTNGSQKTSLNFEHILHRIHYSKYPQKKIDILNQQIIELDLGSVTIILS
jgi:hypothetical protein